MPYTHQKPTRTPGPLRETWLFIGKQLHAGMFALILLTLILLTHFWYPLPGLARYDFLFLAAVGIQLLLLVFRLETPREALVIFAFHLVGTIMELFKTSATIRSWEYPEQSLFILGNVPLFTGFMYSAVGSYIARSWRSFDFRFSAYPPLWITAILALLIYINFFLHHYIDYDFRWLLLTAFVLLFFRTRLYYTISVTRRSVPIVISLLFTATLIWIAENLSTFANIWIYPSQKHGWTLVSPQKIIAWLLLMSISFILVSLAHRPAGPEPG